MSQLGSVKYGRPKMVLINQQQDANIAPVDCYRINNNVNMSYQAVHWSLTAPTAGKYVQHQSEQERTTTTII